MKLSSFSVALEFRLPSFLGTPLHPENREWTKCVRQEKGSNRSRQRISSCFSFERKNERAERKIPSCVLGKVFGKYFIACAKQNWWKSWSRSPSAGGEVCQMMCIFHQPSRHFSENFLLVLNFPFLFWEKQETTERWIMFGRWRVGEECRETECLRGDKNAVCWR